MRNASATSKENLPFNFNPSVSCLSRAKTEAEKTEIEEAVINFVVMDIHQRSSFALLLSHERCCEQRFKSLLLPCRCGKVICLHH